MEYRPDEENKKDLEYTPLFPAHTNQSADADGAGRSWVVNPRRLPTKIEVMLSVWGRDELHERKGLLPGTPLFFLPSLQPKGCDEQTDIHYSPRSYNSIITNAIQRKRHLSPRPLKGGEVRRWNFSADRFWLGARCRCLLLIGPRVVRVGTHALSRDSKATVWSRLSQPRETTAGRGLLPSSAALLEKWSQWRRRRWNSPSVSI